MVLEASRDGTFSDPQLQFSTEDTEASAVVELGDEVAEGSTLTVAWYRLTGVDGRDHLFSHQIVVGPGGPAFSQGVAEGGLLPGLYETVATLGERQVRTPWVVRIADQAQSSGAGLAVVALPLLSSSITLAQSTLEDWEVPRPGESGWADPETAPASPPPPGACEVDSIIPGMVPLTDVKGTVFWLGECSQMTLTATVSGPPQTIASQEIVEGSLSFLRGDADVCELPGGSDMPGTTVRFAANGSEGATGTESYSLPDLGETLTAGIESLPEAGSRVEPGQSIALHAIGMLFPSALGIESLKVYAGGELIDSTGNKSGSSEPIPCDLGRYFAEFLPRYQVPGAPPPVIEICAEATGFDFTQSRGCIEFYTGEVWKGTVTGQSVEHAGPCTYSHDGTVTIVVAEDGMATLDASLSAGGECRGVPAIGEAPFTVTGRRTSAGFEFSAPFPGMGPLTIATTGNHGSGTSTGFVGPTYEVTLDFDVECTSCESPG